VIVHNTSSKEEYLIKKGDRIAQIVLQKVPVINWVPVEDVAAIGENRGGGFGSSGL
jgi:dUTP pyrophosphatase